MATGGGHIIAVAKYKARIIAATATTIMLTSKDTMKKLLTFTTAQDLPMNFLALFPWIDNSKDVRSVANGSYIAAKEKERWVLSQC